MMNRPGLRLLALSVLCAAIAITYVPVVAQNEATEGQWSGEFDFDTDVVHMIGLKNGKVLCIGLGLGVLTGPNKWVLFDPTNDTVSAVSLTPWSPGQLPGGAPVALHNLHCSGHTALPDGRILFNGGPDGFEAKTSIHDPDACTGASWKVLGEVSAIKRFYPTMTTLADGRILAMAGHASSEDLAATPSVFDMTKPLGGQWSTLASATFCGHELNCDPEGEPPNNFYNFHINNYPFMFQSSDGSVLYAGESFAVEGIAIKSRKLNVGTESWVDLFPAETEDLVKGASAVMYRKDKIMKVGAPFNPSSEPATKTAAFVDLASSNTWESLDDLDYARKVSYLIVLADGSVLALGDNSPPELLDPDTPTAEWESMASTEQDQTGFGLQRCFECDRMERTDRAFGASSIDRRWADAGAFPLRA